MRVYMEISPVLWSILVLLSWPSACLSVQTGQQKAASSINLQEITPTRPLTKQSAPYAIGDNNQIQTGAGQPTKNLVFRLSLNQTARDELERKGEGPEPWTFSSQNGTILSHKANLDLRKLLETLNNNNFSSEVLLDHYNPGMVNITISNVHNTDSETSTGLLLEDLLNESRTVFNGSSVVKDNHRFIPKHPTRSKPAHVELPIVTVPPIVRTIDIIAENYTIRQIADEANLFAWKLLHQTNIEKLGSHNIHQSPFAIYQGLALLLSGSMGDTSKELDRILLGSQSVYENTKLTHDQDRSRLLASFNDVVRQLYQSATNHFQVLCNESTTNSCSSNEHYQGGIKEQHLIIANNLLFSPNAYEISNEFKNSLNNYYNNTVITKIEVGSTESIQVINGWIRQATAGVIPSIINKKSTFDEYNVMTLLSTAWLAQEWKDNFRKISSSLRSSIRLKGQVLRTKKALAKDEPLLEFVDDNNNSHFVDYIKSDVTRNIHHYHSTLNGQLVDVVVVPFRDSNQKLVVLTPLNSNTNLSANQSTEAVNLAEDPNVEPPDTSSLSRLIAALTSNPRKATRSLWNTIAPDIITKKVYQNMQQAMQRNSSDDSGPPTLANIPPKVHLSMPLIRSETDSSLTAALNHIGIVNSFDPAQANFIGINGHPFNYYKLHLSGVMFKSTYNLNEFGVNYDRTVKTLESMRILANKQHSKNRIEIQTEMNMDNREPVDDIKLNKPFMYLICDVKTRLILYTGIMRNPTREADHLTT